MTDGFQKDHAGVELTCENRGDVGGYVQLPLLYYRGYQARDMETGEALTVADGDNHVVRVELPAGYRGTVYTSFVSPWYWRASEAVTFIGWCILGMYYVRVHAAKRKQRNRQ